MRRCLASLAIVAWLAAGALAQRPMTPEAKAHLDRGLARFGDKQYAAAIAEFDAGYGIDPHPDFLYAKAQAQRLGGDCRAAVVSYRAFLDAAPPESEAALARGNLERCEAALAASHADAGVEPAVFDAGVEPAGAIDAGVDDRDEPDLAITSRVERRDWYADRPAQVLLAAGTLALVTSGVFALRASAKADASARQDDLELWLDTRAAWRRDRLVAGVALGAGVALAAGAGLRFWMVRDRTVEITAEPTAGGASIVVGGTW